MALDRPRVEAYAEVLDRVAAGRRALDIGAGPFCLLSRLALRGGARTVESVEQNVHAVRLAVDLCVDEELGRGQWADRWLPLGTQLDVDELWLYNERTRPRLVLEATSKKWGLQLLALFDAISFDAPLSGPYDLVIHEILGHIASSEGACAAISDLHKRGLVAPECVFVPSRARTMFVPTESVQFSCLENIVQMGLSGEEELYVGGRYLCSRFPAGLALARAACFEDLDFTGELELRQDRVSEFRTLRSAEFDGLHFYLLVTVDPHVEINAWEQETSWSTTYVRLLKQGMFLPADSRIVCRTSVQLDKAAPRYSIDVSVGEHGAENHVASVQWSGC